MNIKKNMLVNFVFYLSLFFYPFSAMAESDLLSDRFDQLMVLAKQGNADAQDELAGMYYYGQLVKRDYNEAFRLFQQAAKQGNASAQNSIGFMYYHGTGVKQDYKEALRWYKKAAKNGNSNAKFYLGKMYQSGIGVKQDYKEAFDWYQQAAQQGSGDAQLQLGNMYYYGKGVVKSREEALRWYQQAAEKDISFSKTYVKNILDEKEQEQKNIIEQQRQKQRQQDAIANYKAANSPKPSDIGATICKDTDVSEYTGIAVLGQAQFRKVTGATVIASVEGFGSGNQNIRINIKGWLSDNGNIGSGSNVLYKQTPLESGRIVWDNKAGWYKCNY